MTEKASAVVRLRFPSATEARMIQTALEPETESSVTHRSSVQVTRDGRSLTLVFEAKDTTALRASINSYLSWLQLLTSIHDTIESQQS
ncbi:MAG: KEOPS complex subunit Pcc1 [Candidatus Bathyarchaeota archaeon]|nr:KEOPS complex subunit Pcc1 [Candidatus Bathyarchaeota archaeon]